MTTEPMQSYVLEFTEELDKLLAVLEEVENKGFTYVFVNDGGISVIRIICGYEGFLTLAQELPKAGLVPSKFTSPNFLVTIEPELPELQA